MTAARLLFRAAARLAGPHVARARLGETRLGSGRAAGPGGRGAGWPDLVLAGGVLGAVALLLAPVPPWLLDLCLVVNLAGAAAILVAALLAPDALAFASFPSLLLFTTLFRLATAVSATRLVLSRGDAGRVIRAFGEAVVAGSYVTGAVVYAVLTLVQLLVVAKGAERVAEVAARFTLDALPGKQMAIDAELRAGSLDAAEARRRRLALEREGQLHGAMDGALKFVKGDALAGLAIVLVNVVGGTAAGLARGLDPGAAARRYALLAIGDGLTAQVPALLVSLAAGVVVTRVAAEEEGAPLSGTLWRELLGDARVPAAAAGLCAVLAALPGLPAWPFLAVGALAGLAAARARRGHPPPASAAAGGTRARALSAAVEVVEGASPPLVLELSPDLAALDGQRPGRLRSEVWPALEAELARELGVRLPALGLRVAALPPGRWQLLLDEVPAASGLAPPGEAVALLPPAELQAVGIPALAELDPLTGQLVARIAAADAARARALTPLRSPLERLAAGLAAALREHAHLLLGVQEVQGLLEELEGSHPALAREASRQLPVTLLAEVLRRLLEEGVPIRPLPVVLEALVAAGGAARGADALAEAARRALRRQLAHRLAPRGPLEAIVVDAAAEAALRSALAGTGGVMPLQPGLTLLERLESELSQVEPWRRPVLLASADVRRALRDLLAPRFPRLVVVAYDELPPVQAVRPIGRLGIGVL